MRSKLPVLMYHEIIDIAAGESFSDTTATHYNTPVELFDKQLQALVAQGYTSVLLKEELFKGITDGKNCIITFDDGWHGNWQHAVPLLEKYNFKAIFFITTEYIGQEGYMDWDQLAFLKSRGMLIQSHTVHHAALELLSSDDLLFELAESKKIIEKQLQENVVGISFPHGSYNQEVIKIASEIGYKYMFTSDLRKTFVSDLLKKNVIVGRITMRNDMEMDQFIAILSFRGGAFLKALYIKKVKILLRRIIGVRNYHRLYKLLYSVNSR